MMTEEEIMIITTKEFLKAKWKKMKNGSSSKNFKYFFENVKDKIVGVYKKTIFSIETILIKVRTWWIIKFCPFFEDVTTKIEESWKDFKTITVQAWGKIADWWKYTEPYTYVAFYTCNTVAIALGVTTVPYRLATWLQEKADMRLKKVVMKKTIAEVFEEDIGE